MLDGYYKVFLWVGVEASRNVEAGVTSFVKDYVAKVAELRGIDVEIEVFFNLFFLSFFFFLPFLFYLSPLLNRLKKSTKNPSVLENISLPGKRECWVPPGKEMTLMMSQRRGWLI